MAQIKWDEEGSHFYHTGVSKGVLFPFDNAQNRYGTGVAWNGLKTVTETPEGDESSDIYADNLKYLTLMSAPSFKFTIEAYTYPDEFAICDGTTQLVKGVNLGQQPRTRFAARSWAMTPRVMLTANCYTSSMVLPQLRPSVRTTRSPTLPRRSPSPGSARLFLSRWRASSRSPSSRSTLRSSTRRSTRSSRTSCMALGPVLVVLLHRPLSCLTSCVHFWRDLTHA